MKAGFIALSAVLIISAVVLLVVTTVAFLSIGQGQAGLAQTFGENQWQLVDGCAEDALLKLRASALYLGGNITRPEGTCTVGVSSVGTTYTLVVSTTDNNYRRTVKIVATRALTVVTVTSWLEI